MLGELLAVAAALTWAVSVILFKVSERAGDVAPWALNLFKNVLALGLLLATMAATGDGFDRDRSAADWAALAVSGVLGIAIADTLYFAALRLIGPGLLAIVETTYAPAVVVLSVVGLGERVGLAFGVGAALVIGGVVVASPNRALLPEADRDGFRRGVSVGLLGAFFMAAGVVLAKPALERSGLVEATTVRLLAGVGAQLAWTAVRPARRASLRIFRPSPVWRSLVPGSVMGAYVAMLLWLGGMKWADASVAAVLNQLTVVFTLALGAVVFREPLTRGRVAGGLSAMVGAAIIVATR